MTGPRAFLLACYFVLQVCGDLQPPKNLKVSSENFKHILTWEDPSKESPIYYRVEYSERHTPYITAKDCANVTSRRCDLTKDFTNIFSSYRVRVRSFTEHNSSNSGPSLSMTPSEVTVLGPPIVDIVACDRCINVSVQPPISHLWSEDKQQYVSMVSEDGLEDMKCRIEVALMNEVIRTENIEITENYYTVIPNLLPNTNYCISVTITSNSAPSVPSERKCVVTEHNENGGSMVYIIVSVVCGALLLIVLVVVLTGLDIAGYICRARALIPKVLKSMPTSDSIFIDASEFTSPTFSIPVEIISRNFEVEQKAECAVKNGEGGYANRKRLVDSDASGATTASGELPSAASSSVGSSGHTGGSAEEEDISAGSLGNTLPSVGSLTPPPVSATEDSSNPPFDSGGVFNINLNTVSIADPADVWKGFRQVEVPEVEAEDPMESDEAEIASEEHNSICIEIDELEEEYCSEEEEEEDSSENTDSDSHLISGYMRR